MKHRVAKQVMIHLHQYSSIHRQLCAPQGSTSWWTTRRLLSIASPLGQTTSSPGEMDGKVGWTFKLSHFCKVGWSDFQTFTFLQGCLVGLSNFHTFARLAGGTRHLAWNRGHRFPLRFSLSAHQLALELLQPERWIYRGPRD